MTYIKIILKSLFNKKILNLFIIIQLTITMFIILSSLIMLNTQNYLQSKIEERGIDLNRTINLKIYNGSLSDTYRDSFNILESYINDIPEVSNFGGFDFTNTIFKELEADEQYINIRKKEVEGTFKEEYFTSSELLLVDAGIYNILNIKLREGRQLENNDFYKEDDEIIPILIGYDYKDILKIGQVITNTDNNCKYEVIGILEKNLSWLSDQGYIDELPKYLNDKFIVPYTESERTSKINILSKNKAIFYQVNDRNKISYVENIIENKANSLNLRVENNSIYNDLCNFKASTKNIFYQNIFLSVFLIVLSCLGISSIMISSVSMRKKEFGIRIASGASNNFIKLLIIGESSILVFISGMISMVVISISIIHDYFITKYECFGVNPLDTINIQDILIIFIIMISIIVFTTILPLNRFKKMSIKELIGGIE